MLILTLFSIIVGLDFISITMRVEYSQEVNIDEVPSIFDIGAVGQGFYIDPLVGALVILTAIIVIAGIIGIQILGSGLSDEGHRTVMICTIYAGLWTLLSVLSAPMIFSIEIVGAFIYIILTILYIIGVIKKISER